jgi:hypothetical protein
MTVGMESGVETLLIPHIKKQMQTGRNMFAAEHVCSGTCLRTAIYAIAPNLEVVVANLSR